MEQTTTKSQRHATISGATLVISMGFPAHLQRTVLGSAWLEQLSGNRSVPFVHHTPHRVLRMEKACPSRDDSRRAGANQPVMQVIFKILLVSHMLIPLCLRQVT